ncbi:MAG: tetratricopeptide repeat protein [Hyphomicrobiaceae bacterium]|nr:tetratricopeptide repeat protein [Hyphomicrobiaceae bacterium]
MPHIRAAGYQTKSVRQVAVAAAVAASTLLGGCAGAVSDLMPQMLAAKPKPAPIAEVATNSQSELEKATEYWGRKFMSSPNDLKTALNYARNLKAMGQKKQALGVLQQAGVYHGQNRELASEYGRLALDLGQVSVAKPLLAFADDASKPDWRVISARGTVLAKEGAYKESIPYFERAMALSNSNPGVMNNLAMAYALAGEPDRSEKLLRTALNKGAPAKSRQNLALVLGLQGRYDEATAMGRRDLAPQVAQADTNMVRQIVRLDPKVAPVPAGGVWQPPQLVADRAAKSPSNIASAAPAAARPQLRNSAEPSPITGGWNSHVAIATQR